MSNEIFKWQPQMLNITGSNSFNVRSALFENGMEQRGLISERELNSFTFEYKTAVNDGVQVSKLADEIKAFWRARQGRFDNFFLPSWKLETKLSSGASIGASSISVHIGTGSTTPDQLGFSEVTTGPGNFIYIAQGFTRHFEATSINCVRAITEWTHVGSGIYTFNIDSTLTQSFSAGSYVMPAYRVFFDMDELPHTMDIPDAVTYTLQFKEDLASLYELSLT